MQGASRDALKGALARFEESIGSLPDSAGSGEVSEGLYSVAALLNREPSLRRALTDPASSPDARRGLVDNLFGAQLAPLPLSVLRDLVGERWSSAEDLREAVERLAATAALNAAEGEGSLDDVEDELFRFARLLEREPALRAGLTDPGLPDDRKLALLRQLLGGKARPATLRLVEIAVTRSRGRSLETALDDLVELAATRRQRYTAQVRVARPLDADQEGRLVDALTRIYGRQVQLQVDVDPKVLGGIEVRVGDEVIDGTVQRNLNNVRRSLAGQ
ncbi:MAG: F0F1 ATP synthase subunit delta [Frankiaceae bacterium]|nr:F0F1 ATP synthase subunit delta [Frankiaceae bacterium]